MRIIVLGATGGTGRLTVRALLHNDTGNHTVVCVARNPAALDDLAAEVDTTRLTIVKGDLTDAASLQPAFEGADVVVFAAGVASIKQAATQKTTVYSVGGKNMLAAMKEAGVKRLVAVTSQGVLKDHNGKFVYNYIIKPLLMYDMYADMRRLEDLIHTAASEDGLSFTILRPTRLMDQPVSGDRQPIVGEGFVPKGSAFEVDRADLAALIVKAVMDPAAYAGKVLYISA